MDKDEMKNKISMVLKDPILQQGFEIICKNIAELEKENAELRAKESFVGEQNRKLCDQQLRIEVLEKENAELKGIKDVATLIRANNDTVITLMQLNNMLVSKSQQLTKATELIEDMYDAIPSSHSDYYKDVMERARQFISEVEK